MNPYDFWKHIGEIDDELIQQVNADKKPHGFMKRAVIGGVSIAACIALVLLGIHSVQSDENIIPPLQSAPATRAYAPPQAGSIDKGIIVLGGVKAHLWSNRSSDYHDFRIEHYTLFGRSPSSNGIWFSFSGDEISSIDFSCLQGDSYVYSDDVECLGFTNDIKAMTLDHYFEHAQTVKNIKCEKGKYINLGWFCDTYTDEVLDYISQYGYTEEQYYEAEDPEMIALVKEYNKTHLNDSDEITKYYGDTLYIKVNYRNGTSATATIKVNIDYEYKDGNRFGYGVYKLIYK